MPEHDRKAPTAAQALADLRENYDFYDPVKGRYLLSFIGNMPPAELMECGITLDGIRAAIAALRERGIDYRDGNIAPYELFDLPVRGVSVDVAYTRLLWTEGDPEARLQAIAAEIACGGWVRVGPDLDQFVERCEETLAASFDSTLRAWERDVARRPGSRAICWELTAGGSEPEPLSVATAAAMFCDQLRVETPTSGGDIPLPEALDVLFGAWVSEHEREGVLMHAGAPTAARAAAARAADTLTREKARMGEAGRKPKTAF